MNFPELPRVAARRAAARPSPLSVNNRVSYEVVEQLPGYPTELPAYVTVETAMRGKAFGRVYNTHEDTTPNTMAEEFGGRLSSGHLYFIRSDFILCSAADRSTRKQKLPHLHGRPDCQDKPRHQDPQGRVPCCPRENQELGNAKPSSREGSSVFGERELRNKRQLQAPRGRVS